MPNIKIGIIGAGGMASYHLEGFRKAEAEIIAIADAVPGKAAEYAKSAGIPKSFLSLKEMADACPEITGISIITPNKFHKPIAVEALNRGLHVYCEKPPALNAAEMAEMYAASQKSGKTLMFGFNNRARPEAQAMMQYIKKGEVGTINSAQATWIRRAGIPGFGGWFTNKALAGGGPVIDLPHMIDLALYFMDFPEPDYVLARTYNDFMGNKAFKGHWGIPDNAGGITDVEAACHAMLTFKTGQCLMIRNSWAEMNEREIISVVFQGSKAGGKVERLFGRDGGDSTSADSCRLYTEENGYQVNRDILVPRDENMGRTACAANFIETIALTAAPLNTPAQALSLMKIIDAIYASSVSNAPVKIGNVPAASNTER